jgi:hypothetical protein
VTLHTRPRTRRVSGRHRKHKRYRRRQYSQVTRHRHTQLDAHMLGRAAALRACCCHVSSGDRSYGVLLPVCPCQVSTQAHASTGQRCVCLRMWIHRHNKRQAMTHPAERGHQHSTCGPQPGQPMRHRCTHTRTHPLPLLRMKCAGVADTRKEQRCCARAAWQLPAAQLPAPLLLCHTAATSSAASCKGGSGD